jgi:hypothetical protein
VKAIIRRYRWLIALACIGGMLAGWWLWTPSDTVLSRQMYDRIRLGMTPEEVSRIIGQPPSPKPLVFNYLRAASNGPWEEMSCKGNPSQRTWEMPSEWWLDKGLAIEVAYSDGRVHDTSFNVRHWTWDTPAWKWLGFRAQSPVQAANYRAKEFGLSCSKYFSKNDTEEPQQPQGRITLRSKDVPPSYFDGIGLPR